MSSAEAQDTYAPGTYTVIGLAKKSVVEFKHQYITPEHMLLGMIASNDPGVLQALSKANATPEQIRSLLLHHMRPGDRTLVKEEQLTFSERAKHFIETAKQEAQRSKSAQVSPQHLLVGLTLVTNTVCGAVLRAVGINTDNARGTLGGT